MEDPEVLFLESPKIGCYHFPSQRSKNLLNFIPKGAKLLGDTRKIDSCFVGFRETHNARFFRFIRDWYSTRFPKEQNSLIVLFRERSIFGEMFQVSSNPIQASIRLLLFLMICHPQAGLSNPLITEFLASNQSSLEDEDDDTSDWIEIHNIGSSVLDLGGFALSDDPDDLRKWIFPAGITLNGNARLIVFASGKDRKTGFRLHTNFALSASGGSLFLTDPSGTILSDYSDYPRQQKDTSYGIANDGTTAWLSSLSPGTFNSNPLAGFVKDTVFSKKRGFYEDVIFVEITSATPGASIRYTSDGTIPSPTNGTLYTEPFILSSTTVIKAIAYKDGMIPTNVDAQSYLFTSDIVTQDEMNSSITDSPTYRDEVHEALQGLPVVSLSFTESDVFGFAGIYENPDFKGRSSEREIHFEYFNPSSPDDSTHEPAGLRIHGGNSRQHPKKPLRIYFRDDYGDSRLDHDLFPESRVRSFKTLLLRGGGHDAWTFDSRWDEATLIRNQFHHNVQRNLGQTSPYGRHVNVFLNGEYWGIYELQEFPHEHYNADHHGGDPDDWDIVKHGQEVEAGNAAAWEAMLNLARSGISSSADYEAIQEYLDLENFADAMIQRIWSSDEDWLAPFFLNGTDVSNFEDDKNWYVARRSRNGTSKFYFYSWDAEMSMGIPFTGPRTFENDFSKVANDGSPGIIYDALRRFPEFQLFFADRLQKHMFLGGALTAEPLLETWAGYVDQVRTPMVAESARWGVQAWLEPDRFSPFTRNDEWIPAVNWVRDQFIPNRTREVLDHFTSVNLYPETNAPVANPPASNSTSPIEVALSSSTPDSAIYYTTDGSDPRIPGMSSLLPLIDEDSPVRAIVPTAQINAEIGFSWRTNENPTNIDDWIAGPNGVGFEEGNGYESFISTPLNSMFDVNASAYLRYQFEIPDQATLESLESLTLRMRYDDGFAAYLNGALVGWENFGSATWNSTSSSSHSDADAIVFENFDLTSQIVQLQIGTNTLAIHGQNRSTRSSDFLIQAVLFASSGTPTTLSDSATVFEDPIPITTGTVIKSRTLSESGQWSALSENYYAIATPATAENLLVSEIHYHPADAETDEEIAISSNKDDYEFLEFFNPSDRDIDLSGCFFDRGLSLTLPFGSIIPAGSRRVIVSHKQAFLARYGIAAETFIIGEFQNGSNLSNGGETLALMNSSGELLFSFSYNDKAPWPTEPDGGGPSLELTGSSLSIDDLGVASNWKSSELTHGTPGTTGELSFEAWTLVTYGSSTAPGTGPKEIAPGETESNLVLFARGVDLNNGPAWSISPITIGGQDFVTFTYQVRTNLSGVSVIPEISSDLESWERSAIPVSSVDQADGTTLITVRSSTPSDAGQKSFVRLFVTFSP